MEIWKRIRKFNNQYEVSNKGRIRSVEAVIIRSNGRKYTRKSKVLKPDINHSGYAIGAVCVDKKLISYKVHRLVAEAFISNPDNKPTVNHINGIKHDNRVENLEWATRKEQAIHARDTGLTTIIKGEDIGNSVATEEQVREIREFVYMMRQKGIIRYGRKVLCDRMGLTESCVKDIINGRTWKHLL